MLGEAVSVLVPQVVGFRLMGGSPRRAATDLVLTVTEILRQTESSASSSSTSPLASAPGGRPRDDREHVARVRRDMRLLPGRRANARVPEADRQAERIALVEAYCKENLLWHDPEEEPTYSQVVELDLGDVEPSLAGPRRPQDRVPLHGRRGLVPLASSRPSGSTTRDSTRRSRRPSRRATRPSSRSPGAEEPARPPRRSRWRSPQRHRVPVRGTDYDIEHGSVVIAAITSCTNTSNPQVMVGAGLLAKKAVERGLTRKPWVKSSLAPGSKVVTSTTSAPAAGAARGARLPPVGYGCTTCIGNSGPLPEPISEAVAEGDLVVCSVLSGNRNFEARIHSEVKANYLASPLVVAYAIAGRMDVDLVNEPLDGDVYLHDIWPTPEEIQEVITESVRSEMFERTYADVFAGDENWRARPTRSGASSSGTRSTYVRRPPYFDGMTHAPSPSRTFAARAASSWSATRSRPTTSRPPARSGRTRPPART